LTAKEIGSLATLPGREQLLSMLLAPAAGADRQVRPDAQRSAVRSHRVRQDQGRKAAAA
jgi:hypothetical protein